MKKNFLFLDGNSEKEFYNSQRNNYENVTATNIFKNNTLLNKIVRKVFLKLKLPFFNLLLGNWKKNIENYDVIILSASVYSTKLSKYIQKKNNTKIIHWYWNPVSKSINPLSLKSNNSEIWSFDKLDSKNYNLNYIPTYYFSNLRLPLKEIVNDIYFIGADKGRLNELLKLRDNFEEYKVKTRFYITKSKESIDENYSFQPQTSYNQVLDGIAESKAILDIVQDGQTGMSQRPMESIFFKKKLITNDINIKKYDFYNPDNIFILDESNIADINKFINSKYIDIDQKIIKKYDFGEWLNQISN